MKLERTVRAFVAAWFGSLAVTACAGSAGARGVRAAGLAPGIRPEAARPAASPPSTRSGRGEDMSEPLQLELSLATGRAVYSEGESIPIELRIRNGTGRPIVLRFASGQRYDFAIRDSTGAERWRWSADRQFTQMLGEQTLEPGRVLRYGERFEGTLPPGSYRLLGQLTSSNRPASAWLTVEISRDR
ncbi:MAG: BsuPI-related putative proteinase inhibitor [Gemmatimonadota bacterium]